MHAVGFSLYMDLLSRAVEALKSGKEPELDAVLSENTEIDLQVSALIPEAYLGDVHLRLQFYKRIASGKNQTELDEIQVEMIDRFGLLPEPLKTLFAITAVKLEALKLGIRKIEAHSKGGKIEFGQKPNVDPMKIIRLIQNQTKKYRLDGPTKLRFTLDAHENKDRLNLVEKVLAELSH
jgi:transcription-repair coupling factor (superfamily II helicase)